MLTLYTLLILSVARQHTNFFSCFSHSAAYRAFDLFDMISSSHRGGGQERKNRNREFAFTDPISTRVKIKPETLFLSSVLNFTTHNNKQAKKNTLRTASKCRWKQCEYEPFCVSIIAAYIVHIVIVIALSYDDVLMHWHVCHISNISPLKSEFICHSSGVHMNRAQFRRAYVCLRQQNYSSLVRHKHSNKEIRKRRLLLFGAHRWHTWN